MVKAFSRVGTLKTPAVTNWWLVLSLRPLNLLPFVRVDSMLCFCCTFIDFFIVFKYVASHSHVYITQWLCFPQEELGVPDLR